jgi:hypothetical protein
VKSHPFIILDFHRKQVVEVTPGNKQEEQSLDQALAIQRKLVTTASGTIPPQPDSE